MAAERDRAQAEAASEVTSGVFHLPLRENRSRYGGAAVRREGEALWLLVFLLLVGSLLVFLENWSISNALAVAVSAWGTVLFALRFLAAIGRDESLWFESHWGGLGQGVGGFRIPLPWLLLFASLVFGCLLILAARQGAVVSSKRLQQPAKVTGGAVAEPNMPPGGLAPAGDVQPPADVKGVIPLPGPGPDVNGPRMKPPGGDTDAAVQKVDG